MKESMRVWRLRESDIFRAFQVLLENKGGGSGWNREECQLMELDR